MRTRLGAALVAGGIALAASAQPASAVVYYITTGIQGQQVQLDSAHPNAWLISPTATFDFGGGNFTMKDGSATAATITINLFLGANASGTLLETKVFTQNNFCDLQDDATINNSVTPGDHCQQFANVPLHFDAFETLTVGNTYFFELLSQSAPDVQSQAYFIKGLSDATIQGPGGEQPPGDPGVTQVPEPMSLGLLGMGLLGLGLARRRR
jgi:hypothetical protein